MPSARVDPRGALLSITTGRVGGGAPQSRHRTWSPGGPRSGRSRGLRGFRSRRRRRHARAARARRGWGAETLHSLHRPPPEVPIFSPSPPCSRGKRLLAMPPFMRVADPSPPPSPPTPPTSRMVGGEAVGGGRNSLDAATASRQSIGSPPPLSVGSTLTITTVGSTVSTSTGAVADDVARLAGRHSFSTAPTGRLRRRSSAALPRVRSSKAGANGFLSRLTTGEGGRLHRGRNGGGGATWSTSFKVGPRAAAATADDVVTRGGLIGGDPSTTHDRVARLRTRGAVATASLVPGEWDAENEEEMAELAARVKQQAVAERRATGGGRGRGVPKPQNVKVNLMRQAVVREPATLRLARGGRSPVHDGFVVVANAVRRERTLVVTRRWVRCGWVGSAGRRVVECTTAAPFHCSACRACVNASARVAGATGATTSA